MLSEHKTVKGEEKLIELYLTSLSIHHNSLDMSIESIKESDLGFLEDVFDKKYLTDRMEILGELVTQNLWYMRQSQLLDNEYGGMWEDVGIQVLALGSRTVSDISLQFQTLSEGLDKNLKYISEVEVYVKSIIDNSTSMQLLHQHFETLYIMGLNKGETNA